MSDAARKAPGTEGLYDNFERCLTHYRELLTLATETFGQMESVVIELEDE